MRGKDIKAAVFWGIDFLPDKTINGEVKTCIVRPDAIPNALYTVDYVPIIKDEFAPKNYLGIPFNLSGNVHIGTGDHRK